MSKGLKTTIVILCVMVVLGLITLPGLRQAVQRLRSTPKTEEQARREVMQEPISTPTDAQVQAQMYWLSLTTPIRSSQRRSSFRFPPILWSAPSSF